MGPLSFVNTKIAQRETIYLNTYHEVKKNQIKYRTHRRLQVFDLNTRLCVRTLDQ